MEIIQGGGGFFLYDNESNVRSGNVNHRRGRDYLFLGGAGGASFLRGSNSPVNKFKPLRSGKIINICAVITMTRGSRQKLSGRGARPKIPPPHTEKETHHTEKIAPMWNEKTAHIEKCPPRGKHGIFLFLLLPPGKRLLLPPLLASVDHNLHSHYK